MFALYVPKPHAVFRQNNPMFKVVTCPIGGGAAGAIEAISCILSMKNSIVPPTINHFTDDPEIDPKMNFTFNKAQNREVNFALSNTFGFGGPIAG